MPPEKLYFVYLQIVVVAKCVFSPNDFLTFGGNVRFGLRGRFWTTFVVAAFLFFFLFLLILVLVLAALVVVTSTGGTRSTAAAACARGTATVTTTACLTGTTTVNVYWAPDAAEFGFMVHCQSDPYLVASHGGDSESTRPRVY